ncbi:MAG: hypothetical protein NZ954_08380 [Thermofilaceae archaeon]|nr:hypothetical protein [Thermofilaceae archaeon]MCX8179905.1 hypothetical protein [Thermofilaceae archaeon]MDW8004404.1 hypothetical protein [Thermofilaceae archaeon]
MEIFRKIRRKLALPNIFINISLKEPAFYVGEYIEGTVQVTAQENVTCSGVRCEISCVESIRSKRKVYNESLKREEEREEWVPTLLFSHKSQISGLTYMFPGYAHNFPFKVHIPENLPPSTRSLDKKVVWSVKGVVSVLDRPNANSRSFIVQVAEEKPSQGQQMVLCSNCNATYSKSLPKCPNCGSSQT